MQQEILEFELSPLLADSNVNTLCGVFWFDKKYPDEIIEKAFNLMYEHEEGARIRFCEEDGEFRQYVKPYKYVKLPVVNEPTMTADEFREMLETSSDRKISFMAENLYFQKLYHLKDADAVLMVGHHLICDGYTWGLVGHRLGELCHKLYTGENIELSYNSYFPEVDREKKQFESARFQKSCEYWKERLADWEGVCRISEIDADEDDIDADRYVLNVEGDALTKIIDYCREKSIMPGSLFLAAMVLYLHRLNPEKKKIVLGHNISNRASRTEKETIGMFTAEGIICVDMTDDITFGELMGRLAQASRKMFFTRPCCYDQILEIVQETNPEEEEIRMAEFSYQVTQNLHEYGVKAEWIPNYMPEVPLEFTVFNLNALEDIELIFDYRTSYFTAEEIAKTAEFMLNTAALIAENDSAPIKEAFCEEK